MMKELKIGSLKIEIFRFKAKIKKVKKKYYFFSCIKIIFFYNLDNFKDTKNIEIEL
jgi:hypothetical protein